MLGRTVTQYVTARDGTRIAWHTHFETTPSHEASDLASRPTLLLTNGLGTTERFWRHLTHVFARDHRVCHWNYRGHGASESAVGRDYALRTHADDLARVTEAVIAAGDGHTPPIHVAFSMGVAVLLELYRVRPDLVRGMVLLSGPADAPYANTLPLRLPGVMPLVRGGLCALSPVVPLGAKAFSALATSRVAYPLARAMGLIEPSAPERDIADFTAALATMDPRAFWGSMIGLLEGHASDVLPTVRVPVQLIAAERDLFVPASQMSQMRAALPNVSFAKIEGSGHAVLVESGPEVAAAIRLFLREHFATAAG